MNNIEIEIMNMSAFMKGYCKPIDTITAQGFLIRGATEYQLAIPFDKEGDYSDEFVGIKLSKGSITFDGKSFNVLYLHAVDTIDLEKFACIGQQFLSLKSRKAIIENPYDWCDRWREIFGDSIKHKMIFDVLGEMMALRAILKTDPTVKWEGPNSGSQDIVGEKHLYEVKTTTAKKESVVHINSAIQLKGSKPESLVFVRLERMPYGETIDKLEADLIALGYPKNEIEACLLEKGIIKGSKYRKVSYDLIEIRDYPVSPETFPTVSLEKLNEGAPMRNITDYQLTLDLDTVPYTSLFAK